MFYGSESIGRWVGISAAASLLGTLAHASVGSSSLMGPPAPPRTTLAPADTRVSGEVGLSSTGYLYPGPATSTLTPDVYAALGARVDAQGSGKWVTGRARGQAELYLEADHPIYAELPEAYVASSPALSPTVNLALGRRMESWSRLDADWELGLFQPRFRWDYLHPDSVGLAGAFLNYKQGLLALTGFGSGIYIPERGIPVSVQDGNLVANSRWFLPPPRSATIYDQPTPIQYNLAMPETSDIIFHPSFAFHGRVGEEQGPWAGVAWARKPMNQLLLGMDAYLDVSHPAQNLSTSIHPRVVNHQLYSLEAGEILDPLEFWISYLHESPERDATPASWITQEVSDSNAVSPGVRYRFAGQGERAELGLSYLHQRGGNASDGGDSSLADGSGRHSLFEKRYPFQDAFLLTGSTPLFSRLNARSRVLFDAGRTGLIFSGELAFRPSESWRMGLGWDLLATTDAGDADPDDFINRYRADHRIHAGVSYVF